MKSFDIDLPSIGMTTVFYDANGVTPQCIENNGEEIDFKSLPAVDKVLLFKGFTHAKVLDAMMSNSNEFMEEVADEVAKLDKPL